MHVGSNPDNTDNVFLQATKGEHGEQLFDGKHHHKVARMNDLEPYVPSYVGRESSGEGNDIVARSCLNEDPEPHVLAHVGRESERERIVETNEI